MFPTPTEADRTSEINKVNSEIIDDINSRITKALQKDYIRGTNLIVSLSSNPSVDIQEKIKNQPGLKGVWHLEFSSNTYSRNEVENYITIRAQDEMIQETKSFHNK